MPAVGRDRSLPEMGTRELLDFLRAYRASGAFDSPSAAAVPSSDLVAVIEAADCGRAPRSRRVRRQLAGLFAWHH